MYEISNAGRLRSWRRKPCAWRNAHDDTRESPIIISGTVTQFGYTAYILRHKGSSKPYRRLAHRLLAIAFLENPNSFPDVAHNDGNPRNNNISNLRWSSHRDNQMDMRKHGTMQDGEKCVTVKISEQDAAYIKEAAKIRGNGIRLAEQFGLSKAQISRIKNGKRWQIL